MRKRVIRQIEELLYHNEYVVVPGLGAFLRHIHPAEADETKGLIYPPKNSLSFNAALSQSDGILQQSYVRRYGISQKKADALIREDVSDLSKTLRSIGMIQVGSLGKLWLNGAGKIEFAPDTNHPYTTYFFGYTPVVSLSAKGSRELLPRELPEEKETDTVYLPLNLHLLRYGAVAALLILALLLFPTVLTDKSLAPSQSPQYQAGFLTGVSTEETDQPETVSTPVPAPIETKAEPAVSHPSETLAGLPLLRPVPDEGAPKYYVVISTLRSEEAVRKFIEDNNPGQAINGLGILHTNRSGSTGGTYRVFTSVSDDKEEAELLMKQLHTLHPEYADAWVYQYPLQ